MNIANCTSCRPSCLHGDKEKIGAFVACTGRRPVQGDVLLIGSKAYTFKETNEHWSKTKIGTAYSPTQAG